MNKINKFVLGILSFIPLVYLVFIMMSLFTGLNFETFDFINKLHLGVMGLTFLLVVILSAHLFFSSSKQLDTKLLWFLVLVVGNMLVFPIYWYLNVWQENKASTPPNTT
jgi:hypothetical protein